MAARGEGFKGGSVCGTQFQSSPGDGGVRALEGQHELVVLVQGIQHVVGRRCALVLRYM